MIKSNLVYRSVIVILMTPTSQCFGMIKRAVDLEQTIACHSVKHPSRCTPLRVDAVSKSQSLGLLMLGA
jgi:hypothetical protein